MKMGKLDGKVAVITGSNKGIGKGIARAFVKNGASVVLAARNEDDLNKTREELSSLVNPEHVLSVPTDVTDESQVENLFAGSIEQFGRLDILVNNAGAFDGGRLDMLSTEAWDHVIGVNLRGPFLCSRAAFRIMKDQGGGRIINIGSISAQRVRPGSAPYSASKFGISGLTHATALDGREFGIVASCLHPGNIYVERRQDSGKESDDEPMMSVDELAESALLMASLPLHVNVFEAVVLPTEQLYVGRG